MADDIIQIAADGSGKMVDNSSLTVGSNTVYRQRFNLADPTDPYGLAKVMSTRPVGTEMGLVVRTVGNNYIQGAPQPNATGTIGTLNASVGGTTDFSTAGNMTVMVTGSYTMSLAFETSWDGSNWFPIQGSRSDNGAPESVTVYASITANRSWNFGLQGYNYFRVRCATYGSGTATVICDGGTGWFSPTAAATAQGSTATGTAFTNTVSPVVIGGGSVAGGTNATAATVKAASTAAASTDTALVVATHPSSPLPAGSNTIGAINVVNATATAKSTQGANGLPVQDLKDAGRSLKMITLNAYAVTATGEILMTPSLSTDNGTSSALSSSTYTVTSGKRFRLQQIIATLHTVSGNTTASGIILRLRAATSGAISTTSNLQLVLAVPGTATAFSSTAPVDVAFPDGLEFASASTWGITSEALVYTATTAAPRLNVTIIGYEY